MANRIVWKENKLHSFFCLDGYVGDLICFSIQNACHSTKFQLTQFLPRIAPFDIPITLEPAELKELAEERLTTFLKETKLEKQER